MGRLFRAASDVDAERLAQDWYDSLDLKRQVGARHHIVPRATLRRFANDAGQVRIRDRFTSKLRLAAIADLAVRDFYTFVDHDAKLNGSMEVWLSEVENEFTRAVRPLLSTHGFTRSRALTRTERFAIDTFVAVQSVRGMRTRRAMELVADYSVKLLNQDNLDAASISDLEIVPHQNDHIALIHTASEKLADNLASRPVTVACFDSAALIIGDEPVVLSPRPGFRAGDQRRRVHIDAGRVATADLVQVSSGLGVGFADADEVLIPLSPRHLLIYGPPGAQFEVTPATLAVRDSEAARTAREINRLQARSAFGWVAAHPDGPHLAQIPWPPAAPAAIVYDDHSAPASVMNARPHARPHRLSD